MTSPVLSVESLRTVYRVDGRTIVAVDDVSLSLRRGEVLALVGESGCGKSATVLSILDLVRRPGHVTRGSVMFQGRDLLRLPPEELRRIRGKEIGLVLQDPATSLNPLLRIGTQIMDVLGAHLDLSRKRARHRAIELLDAVELPDPERALDSYPHELSGGMRQRVGIAIALSCDPDVLLADEPTTALDVTLQAEILDLIRAEQRRRRMAVVFVSHDFGVVARVADRVAVLYGGRVVETGAAADVLARPAHPYTALLLEAIPRVGTDSRSPLAVIPGQPPTVVAPAPAHCLFAPRCPNRVDRCVRELPPLARRPSHPQEIACWNPWAVEG